jgi:hypothetical protein
VPRRPAVRLRPRAPWRAAAARALLPLVAVLAAVLAALLATGCDATPGPSAPAAAPPRVAGLTFAPDTLRAADLPAADTVRVDVDVTVTVIPGDAPVREVLATLEPSQAPFDAREVTLADQGDGTYAGTLAFPFPTARDDVYALNVFAIDEADATSNLATGLLRFLP